MTDTKDASESKYQKQKVIAVDVDNTLIIDNEPNQPLIEWIIKKKEEGYRLILWSARGEDNAIQAAMITGTTNIFDTIISKPGYIVDDDEWFWTILTEVISPDIKVVKRKRRAVMNSGAAMRRQRGKKRSKL